MRKRQPLSASERTRGTRVAGGIGHQFARLRRERHLTLRQCAQLAGLSSAAVCKIENGLLNPTLLTIVRLAESLGAVLQVSLVERRPGGVGRPRARSALR